MCPPSENYKLIVTNKSENGQYITGVVSGYIETPNTICCNYVHIGKFILELKKFPNLNTTEYNEIFITKYELVVIFNYQYYSDNFNGGFTLKGTYESTQTTVLSDFNVPFNGFKTCMIENNNGRNVIEYLETIIVKKLPCRIKNLESDNDICEIYIRFK